MDNGSGYKMKAALGGVAALTLTVVVGVALVVAVLLSYPQQPAGVGASESSQAPSTATPSPAALPSPTGALGSADGGLSVEEALSRTRERAADLLGVSVDDVRLLGEYHKAPVTVGSQRFLLALLSTEALTDQILLAVDMDSGEVLDEFTYEMRLAAALADRDKFSPPARAALEATDEPQTFIFGLAQPDYGPAAAAFIAAHPEIQWDEETPITDDTALAEELWLGLLRAKAAALREARAPFLEAVEAGGGEVVAMYDLVAIVYVRGSPDLIRLLASRSDVGEVALAA